MNNKLVQLLYGRNSEEIVVEARYERNGAFGYASLGSYKSRIDAIVHVLHLAEKRAVQKLLHFDEIKGTYWEYDYEID